MSVTQISEQQVKDIPSFDVNHPLTIILGAGASIPSGLPSWNSMVENLLFDFNVVSDKEIAGIIAEKCDPIILAEAIHKQAVSKESWMQALCRALYGKDNASRDYTISAMHANAARLACANPEGVRLATLNFDQFIEQAIEIIEKQFQVSNAKMPPVEHLHGIVPRNGSLAPDNMPVFSFFDYLENLTNKNTRARHFLADAIDNGYLLISGTTFRDPDMRQWLGDILHNPKEAGRPKAYIIIEREGLEVSADIFKKMQPALEREWGALEFTPIFVNDYNDSAQIIKELIYRDKEGYKSPQLRSEQLWKALTNNIDIFHNYQRDFSSLLLDQKQTIKNIFADNSMFNATLWLSHGDNLTRFATYDRIYLRPDLLRNIPTGFDSPFIAGKVLSNNEIGRIDSLDPQKTRWNTILAAPITITPRLDYYSPLLIGALTFGSTGHINQEKESYVKKAIADMANDWAARLGAIAESIG